MKIFIFGANGMIGHYLCSYLKSSVPVTRDMVNALHIRQNLLMEEFDSLNIRKGDCVINTIGITNKYTKDFWEFLAVNSIFPRLLADYCEDRGVNMIHISTDCVFSGKKGSYSEDDEHDDVIDAIIESAATGRLGDGKIFVYDVCDAVKIRTGESGETIL